MTKTMFRMSTCNSRSRRRKFIDAVATRTLCISKTSTFGSILHQCLFHFHPHGQGIPSNNTRRRFDLKMKKRVTIQCFECLRAIHVAAVGNLSMQLQPGPCAVWERVKRCRSSSFQRKIRFRCVVEERKISEPEAQARCPIARARGSRHRDNTSQSQTRKESQIHCCQTNLFL